MHIQRGEPSATSEEFQESSDDLTAVPDSGRVRGVVARVWRVLLFWLAVLVLMYGAYLIGRFAG